MTFKKVFSSLFVFSLLCNVVFAEETKKTEQDKKQNTEQNEEQKTEQNAFTRFIYKYVLPEKNPIFQDKTNSFDLAYYATYNSGNARIDGVGGGAFSRAVHSIAFHYAQPDKFFRVHGRLSVGGFVLFGVKGVYKDLYKAYGIEVIQELIFGTPMFYLSAGIGPSFMMGNMGRTANEHDGLTGFNFSSVVKIGHRFDCGAIIELAYHHLSNGGLGRRNQGLDMIGLSAGYVF